MGSFEVTLLLAVTLLGAVAGEGKSNGFGTDIDWLSWEDMKSFDYKSNTKPIMYVFSKPWCGACKRLKAEFTGPEGGKITDMSKDFVMVGSFPSSTCPTHSIHEDLPCKLLVSSDIRLLLSMSR